MRQVSIVDRQLIRLETSSNTAIIMPDDVAEEKVKALRSLGAEVERVRPASIVDKRQVRHLCYLQRYITD